METIEATVVTLDDKVYIKIADKEKEIKIPMCEDKSNEVKSAFNILVTRLKAGKYRIKLMVTKDDLFHQVANEYITQLNRELIDIFGEMKQYGLVRD